MAIDQQLQAYLEPLATPHEKLRQLTHDLSSRYTELALNSDDQFLATPVTKLPTGAERGEYLAIDLGGSNLRVAFINLLGLVSATGRRFSLPEYDERIEKFCQRSWPIGDNLKDEKAEDLFAWIGDCLAEVIRARYEDVEVWPEEIPMGITFSFPMMQSTLSEASLMPMGKGFKITSNPDVGSMVLAGLPVLPRIKLKAISNDSVATLISLSYTTNAKPNSKAVVGLILGTGTNAAVPMPPASLQPKKVAYAARGRRTDQIVVNTEWTIRGVASTFQKLNVITRWDEVLDHALSTPGFQPFEYMTAGTYLGEIVRIAVREYFVEQLGIAESTLPVNLVKPYGLSTSWLGHKVATTDDVQTLTELLNTCPELSPSNSAFSWTPTLANVLLQTERAVSKRSTALVASAIIALLIAIGELTVSDKATITRGEDMNGTIEHVSPNSDVLSSGERELVVAYCGGLICLYHGYLDRLKGDLHDLKDTVKEKDANIVLREASEGGVIGAGVLAGVAAAMTE